MIRHNYVDSKSSTSHLSIGKRTQDRRSMKNLLFKIALGLAMQIVISSCIEFEMGRGKWGTVYGSGYDLNYDSIFSVPRDSTFHPAFFIDSVSQIDKSTVTIWAHILYDTVLVINARTAYTGYLDQPEGEGYSIIQSQPDTLNFRQLTDTTSVRNGRKEWIYKYTVDVDSLRSGTTYWFCTINFYTEFTTSWPIWQADYTCTDYFELK